MLLVDFKDIELDKKMGKNKFLPVSSDVEAQDIELSLMSEGRPAAAVAAMGHVTQSLPKATKTKPWVKKMFSALAFLGLLFGGTIGFSTIVIAEDQVGYYNSESGYMGPGTYLQFPWATEKMQIVKVRGKYLRLDNLAGVAGNHKFRIKKIYVHYTVTDVDKYIQTLKEVSPTYCRTEMRNAILVYLMPGDLIRGKYSVVSLKDIPVPECALFITRGVFFGHHIITEPQDTTTVPLTNDNIDFEDTADDSDDEIGSGNLEEDIAKEITDDFEDIATDKPEDTTEELDIDTLTF